MADVEGDESGRQRGADRNDSTHCMHHISNQTLTVLFLAPFIITVFKRGLLIIRTLMLDIIG